MSRNNETTFTLNTAAREALKTFRDSKPWRGTIQERADKFAELHRGLCRAYDLETMLIRDTAQDPECTGGSGGSEIDRRKNAIILRGKLSVVTYLFLFAAAAGCRNRMECMTWSRDMFRHFFPRSFAGTREDGGLLIRA